MQNTEDIETPYQSVIQIANQQSSLRTDWSEVGLDSVDGSDSTSLSRRNELVDGLKMILKLSTCSSVEASEDI